MEHNFVNVPYDEFLKLSYCAAVYDIIENIITDTTERYIDTNTLRTIYGKCKLEEA